MDDNANLQGSETSRELQEQNQRLQMLLNLTKSITADLELRSVLRSIAANIRGVMHCDAATILLPGTEAGTFRNHAVDFPGTKGFLREEQIVTPGKESPVIRACETLQPVISGPRNMIPDNHRPNGGDEIRAGGGHRIAMLEGIKSSCFIPLLNRGRARGVLILGRATDDAFTKEDVDFLTQAAGQIAIAIDNALAFEEISELKDKLTQEKLYLEEELRSEMSFEQIVGNSAGIRRVLQLVETVAPNDSTVLLLGETGTGKELIARAIHERSLRKERTFVKLNCAAIPTGLLESELFGHERGAFTGAITQKTGRMELADQGTLFLDEVGDIPLEIQPKLLRALQEREFERLGSTHTRKVNVRLIAATNRDLEQMISEREFRSDLFYRLHVFPIRIPPLRERREDIPLLVSYFVQKFAKQMQKQINTIPVATMKGLVSWEWPGNIRELENFIERAVILTRGEFLEAPLSELHKRNKGERSQVTVTPAKDDIARIVKETISALKNTKDGLREFDQQQRQEIVRVLTETKGRVGGPNGAAARMGLNRTTLLARIKKHGINAKQFA